MDAKDLISRSAALKSLGERKMACERRDYMSDTISRQDAIDEVVAWLKDRMSDGKNGKPLTDRLKDLPSAQPEPYIDSIVSEIKKTISETKESGKHHEIRIRTNGEMICFGLQLALEIIEEKMNERSDIQASGD